MNAFDAAEENGKAEELHSQLVELAKVQNQSKNGGTSIPAAFLRVTVCLPLDSAARWSDKAA